MHYKSGNQMGLSKRLLVVAILLVVVFVMAGLELAGVTHIFHKKTQLVVSGSSFNTKGEPKSTKSSTQVNSSGSGTPSSSKSTGTSAVLITPSGSFVSNHHPNLGGSPAPNLESSVCATTPGATCTISFTMGGTTKSLEARTADSNGAAFWDWKLQDIGLTAGTWKIQAAASLNGQTRTASDAMDLTVAQ
jgi:hypothetical protein